MSDLDVKHDWTWKGETPAAIKKVFASYIAPGVMEQVLKHGAKSWQEREESWLQAFHALQISAALTVSTII